MRSEFIGQRPNFVAVTRSAMLGCALLLGVGLSACTTTEGTNALTDPGTFEREVMDTTAVGLGLIPGQVKPDPTGPRAPLVLPRNDKILPPPTTDTEAALLPKDSNKVQINTAGLSTADLQHLKNARVVDLHTIDGRPLTDVEARQLTARMKAARVSTAKRSIFLPPETYFTGVDNAENLVCLAASGDLVSVNDPSCPPEIRKALLAKGK
jgi:hypothetical protein